MIVVDPGKAVVQSSTLLTKPLMEDELIVRLDSAPFNPSDYFVYMCTFPRQQKPPFRLGLEGFGVIEKAASDSFKNLIGKKCLFVSMSGSYATHVILKRHEICVLDDDANLEAVCQNFLINPLTAYELVHMAKSRKAEAIVHDAASSNVGKWITVLAKKEGIKTIAIVRNDKYNDTLMSLGATIVLNSEEKLFDMALKAAIVEYRPTVFLDALAGDKPIEILSEMPNDSVLINYGSMESKTINGISFFSLLAGKSITGFVVLFETIQSKPNSYWEKAINEIYKLKEWVHEPIQYVNFDEGQTLGEQWPKRKARLVLKA